MLLIYSEKVESRDVSMFFFKHKHTAATQHKSHPSISPLFVSFPPFFTLTVSFLPLSPRIFSSSLKQIFTSFA